MDIKLLLRRAHRRYREKGLLTLLSDTVSFVLSGSSLRVYQTSQKDLDQRWSMIGPYIAETDNTALDIGCAEGGITNRLAEHGCFSIGIDTDGDRLDMAIDRYGLNERVGFMRHVVTPDNIEKLPEFDVIILLTIYHHWGNEFGWRTAREMLQTLGEKSDKLVIELPGSESSTPEDFTADAKSLEEYYLAFLNEVFEEQPVKHIGTSTLKRDDGREDPLYYVETDSFTVAE